MLAKYTIEYTIYPEHSKKVERHHTDDPVESEEFLAYLIANGVRILDIKHDGTALDRTQTDRMIDVAARKLTARAIAKSLQLDTAEVKHRFGYAA
jgi:hypothetical protein